MSSLASRPSCGPASQPTPPSRGPRTWPGRPGNGPPTAKPAHPPRRTGMNDKAALQIHSSQRLTTPDGTKADIDTEIVPLVRALWALGLTTTASCQDFGEGTAGQRK